MNYHSEELHDLLHGLAGEIQDVTPLGNKRVRKTRIRRASVAGALALSVAAIGATGALVAFGPGHDAGARLGPAGTPQASIPAPPRPMQGEIEAWGETRPGLNYWLTVYEDGDQICMDLEVDKEASRLDCGAFKDDRAAIQKQPTGRSDAFVYGWIPNGDNELRLIRTARDNRRVATWLPPPGITHPVRFFVITHLPRDVVGLEAVVDGDTEMTPLTSGHPASNGFSFKRGPNVDIHFQGCARSKGAESLRDCELDVIARVKHKK